MCKPESDPELNNYKPINIVVIWNMLGDVNNTVHFNSNYSTLVMKRFAYRQCIYCINGKGCVVFKWHLCLLILIKFFFVKLHQNKSVDFFFLGKVGWGCCCRLYTCGARLAA